MGEGGPKWVRNMNRCKCECEGGCLTAAQLYCSMQDQMNDCADVFC